MKRSPMKPSAKPMSRGKPMKVRRKVRPKIDGIDYLILCRGQDCYLRLPTTPLHPIDTVVACHSNQSKHGKGMGLKASDIFTVPGCFTCHAELDQGKTMSRDEKNTAWDQAYARWEKDRKKLFISILGDLHDDITAV